MGFKERIQREEEGQGGGGVGNSLGKRPGQRLLTADLLRADETLHGNCDGPVDVLRGAVFGQAHFAEGFGDAHDGFEVADLWEGC